MMLNRSSSRRLLSTDFKAFRACSIFLPAIDPDRSSTKMTVLGMRSSVGGLHLGAGQEQEVAVLRLGLGR